MALVVVELLVFRFGRPRIQAANSAKVSRQQPNTRAKDEILLLPCQSEAEPQGIGTVVLDIGTFLVDEAKMLDLQ